MSAVNAFSLLTGKLIRDQKRGLASRTFKGNGHEVTSASQPVWIAAMNGGVGGGMHYERPKEQSNCGR